MQLLLPDGIDVFAAAFLVFASFFTSFLTAALGIGGGLLMLALMAYLLPPLALIPVHGVIQLGSNLSRSVVQRRFIQWRVSSVFILGSVIGVVAGIFFFVQLPPDVLRMLLACFILFMVWAKLPAITNASRLVLTAGGATTTFITMFAGATGPLVAVLFKDLFPDRKQLVATHASAMIAQHGLKVMAFGIAGFAFTAWLPLIAAMLVTGYLGTQAGTRLLHRLPERTFRMLFKITLTLVALDLLRRAVF